MVHYWSTTSSVAVAAASSIGTGHVTPTAAVCNLRIDVDVDICDTVHVKTVCICLLRRAASTPKHSLISFTLCSSIVGGVLVLSWLDHDNDTLSGIPS